MTTRLPHRCPCTPPHYRGHEAQPPQSSETHPPPTHRPDDPKTQHLSTLQSRVPPRRRTPPDDPHQPHSPRGCSHQPTQTMTHSHPTRSREHPPQTTQTHCLPRSPPRPSSSRSPPPQQTPQCAKQKTQTQNPTTDDRNAPPRRSSPQTLGSDQEHCEDACHSQTEHRSEHSDHQGCSTPPHQATHSTRSPTTSRRTGPMTPHSHHERTVQIRSQSQAPPHRSRLETPRSRTSRKNEHSPTRTQQTHPHPQETDAPRSHR